MDSIVEQLRGMILDGRLIPGSALRQEELALRMQVSRTPLREAFMRLEQEGLVTFSTTGVASVVVFARAEALELMDVREMVDGMAARLLAGIPERSAVVRRLLRFVASMEAALAAKDKQAYLNGNEGLHMGILVATGHARLNQLAGIVRVSSKAIYLAPGIHATRLIDSTLEHQQILEAIREGDEEWAETAARAHVRHAREHWIVEGFPSPPEGGDETSGRSAVGPSTTIRKSK